MNVFPNNSLSAQSVESTKTTVERVFRVLYENGRGDRLHRWQTRSKNSTIIDGCHREQYLLVQRIYRRFKAAELTEIAMEAAKRLQ
jgi:hypothetical protein